MSSKIVIKKPVAAAAPVKASVVVPKASSIVVPAKKVVVAPQRVVAAPAKKVVAPAKMVAAPQRVVAPKKASIQKVVYVQEEEVEEVEEEQPMTRDEMLVQALALLSQAMGMKAGRGSKAIKFNKDGSVRQPRGPRENSEKQAAWMAFVKEVRESQGVDENGKFLISHKDAMKLAKEMRAEAGEEAGEEEQEEDEAPAPAPKKVIAAKSDALLAQSPLSRAQKPSPVAAPAKKSPQQIREELAAKKAAEEAAAAAAEQPEEEASVEVEEFEHDGKTYLKNSDNLCWFINEAGEQVWAGVYLPDEDRIDESVEEPTA